MASIPLPALDLKPPQPQPGPMEEYGNLMRLQAMQQQNQQRQALAPYQQQTAQNQAQSSGLQVQQQRMQQASTKALMTSFANLDPSDPNYFEKGIQAAQATGQVLPQQLQTIMNTRLEYQTKAAALPAALQKVQQNRADSLYSLGTQALKAPDPILAQNWGTLRSQIVNLHQGDQNFNPASVPQQFPGRQWVQAHTILQGMSAAGMRAAAVQQEANTSQQVAASEIPKNVAQTHLANVNATLAPQLAASRLRFEQAQLEQGQQRNDISQQKLTMQRQQAGIGPDGMPTQLARDIASGHIPLDRMGYLLARNPGLVQGVMQIDPTFDGSKAAAYPKVYADFTSSKQGTAGGALLSGSTALEHLNELRALNTDASHIYGTAAYNAYMNKAETVASELDRFYHGTSTDTATAQIKKTLVATLPGQRDAGILTQAQSMGDRLDNYEQTWKNAAPSAKYEAPMPGISQAAIKARAALDPSYAERLRSQGGASGGVSNAAPSGRNDPFAQFGGKAH